MLSIMLCYVMSTLKSCHDNITWRGVDPDTSTLLCCSCISLLPFHTTPQRCPTTPVMSWPHSSCHSSYTSTRGLIYAHQNFLYSRTLQFLPHTTSSSITTLHKGNTACISASSSIVSLCTRCGPIGSGWVGE